MEANAFGFDGNAALAFEVHRIEHLLVHLPLAERAGEFEKAVGKRGFAVVNVRDDAKISDVTGVHQFLTGQFPCDCSAIGARRETLARIPGNAA